jgi:hypothetical protein
MAVKFDDAPARDSCHERMTGRVPPARLCETPMKPPPKRLSDLKGSAPRNDTYAPPTPMVSRQKRAKVLTAAERAAFLASRPELTPKS